MGNNDEVNEYAKAGGDTEPETAAAIKARNDALEAYNEKVGEVEKKLADAKQEAQEAHAQLEADLAEQTPELTAHDVTMDAISSGSTEQQEAPKKSSAKASS